MAQKDEVMDDNIPIEHVERVSGQGEDAVCPVCCWPLIMEHGEAVCRSGMCHYRIVEDCC